MAAPAESDGWCGRLQNTKQFPQWAVRKWEEKRNVGKDAADWPDPGPGECQKETPCGYTSIPKKQGNKNETPCGYTSMPKKQGNKNEKTPPAKTDYN